MDIYTATEQAYKNGYERAAKKFSVIRCKDCNVPHNKWTGCPKLNGLVTLPDFYCAFAEPKEKDK